MALMDFVGMNMRMQRLWRRMKASRLLSYSFVIIVAVVVGYFVSSAVMPTPKIAILKVRGPLWDENAENVKEMLYYAWEHGDIEAVVLEIDSPGGEATASEELFMSALRLRERKPVVASIGYMGASGAYELALAANFIYAKPGSFVGSIGVVSDAPGPSVLEEDVITTGPFKGIGSPREKYIRQIEMLKEKFLDDVVTQRGDRLKISREALSTGEIFIGVEGLRLGLVDALGSRADAIEKAAELARITKYQVVDMSRLPKPTLPPPPPEPRGGEFLRRSRKPWPTFYYLYIGPR